MMKTPVYLLFGYKGLIGSEMFTKLAESMPDYRIFAFDHAHIDISNKKQIKEIVNFIKPSIVINCAGISDPEICENAQAGAYEINAVAPKILAQACSAIKAKLVHFSSCMVFKGDRFKPYSEKCKPNPINIIGKSKLSGEQAIKDILEDHLIIRPGWAFSYESPNFLLDWINTIDRRGQIHVPPNIHGSPVFVPDLINSTMELVDRDARGVFHIANSQAATWEGLGDTVLGLTKTSHSLYVMEDLLMSSLPPVPKYSVLSCKKYKSYTQMELRSWPSALKQCLFQMERYRP